VLRSTFDFDFLYAWYGFQAEAIKNGEPSRLQLGFHSACAWMLNPQF